MDLYLYCLLFYFVRSDDVTVDSKTNGDITVTCSSSLKLRNCQWQHESSPDQFKDISGSTKYQNHATLRMTIRSFTFADRGSYRCKCYDRSGDYKYSSNMTIDLADVRTEHRLACGKTGTHYTWTKKEGSTYRQINKNNYYTTTTSRILTLLNVQWNEHGLYRCSYYNNGNHDVDLYLVVRDIADVRTEHHLDCGHNGQHYRWLKKNGNSYTRLNPNSKYSNTEKRLLTLLKVSWEEEGIYKCRYYTNKWHDVELYLIVQGYPEIRFDNPPNKAVLGGSVYMRCSIHETHPSITDVWWTKGYTYARIQADGIKYEIQYHQLDYTSLNVLEVNEHDAGEYRCYARNTRGETFANTKLVTGDLPLHPKAAEKMYRVKERASVVLQCHPQTSIPPITELWWQIRVSGQFRNLTNSLKYSGGTITETNLHITNVRFPDAKDYRCNVANAFGTSQVDMEVQLGKIPTVSATKKQFHPIRGGAVTLICNINEETRIWWKRLKGSKDFDINNNNFSGETTCSLTIQNIQAEDDGDYRCYGENEFGSRYDTITLSSGNIPIIAKSSNAYNGEYDKNLVLSVYVQKIYPEVTNIKWYHKGRALTRRHRYSVSNPSLEISQLRFEDNGTYVCRAGNHIGYANVTMTLSIWKRPTVKVYGKTDIAHGSDATFICYLRDSYPSVLRSLWQKGVGLKSEQTILESNGKYTIGVYATYLTLKVKSVNIDDTNTYTCVAENEFSEGNDSIILNVGSPPLVNISRDYYITEVGKDLTISCVIRNVPASYFLTMKWKKGSLDIKTSNQYTIGSSDKPYLIIKNVKVSDAGIYSFHVQNKYGSKEDSTELKIISASVQRQVYEATARKSYKIHCEVSGGDRVFWRKNGTKLKLNNQQKYVGGNLSNPSLLIRNISYLDKGIYTCETSLENLTAISKKIQLFVKAIPRVAVASQITEITTGSDTILDCSYESFPKPLKIYWKHNEKIIQLSDNSKTKYNGSSVKMPNLVIYDTTQSDSGNYICVVENTIGAGYSRTLQLIVKEPEKNKSTPGVVIGCVCAILVAILIVIGLIVLHRRRSNNVNNKRPFQVETISNAENVELCADGRGNRDNGLNLNVGKVSTSAPENIKPSTVPILAGDNEYYNLSDVQSSCIRVEELQQYIEKKQRNEELKNEYKSIPNVAVHPTTHAQTKDNMPKNRFKTTFPYDHTRVILEFNGGSDYINANYVDGFEKQKCYIASQGPTKATLADHWKMIWQEHVYQIVMLTNLVEGIKIKCEQYWPSGDKQMVHGDLIIRLNAEKERTAYVTREITIEDKKTSKKRKVTQYHFTAWPDHGTPDPLYLVLFHRHVISDSKAGHSGPLLVHCSAGIGRTGTYIALDALLEEGRTTGFLDIFEYLKKMRYSRMNMIQTADQYVCLHYTLLEAFTMKDTKIRKDKFSEVWTSISTDKTPVNHQRLDKEFKDLQQHVREIKGLSSFMLNAKKDEQNQTQHNAAMSTTNLAKNRNKDVIPIDDKRVYLVSYGKGRSDYINAVQVPSYTKFVGYITTQLPLPDTKVDFWTMIRDHSSSTIVLIINNKKEADLVYSQSDDNVTIGEFNIKISARRVEENDITEATIVLSKKDDKPRSIVLFQVICKSIPDPAVLCKLADLISTSATMSNDPITVVSSDGAKNCGLFCAFTNAVSSMQIDNNADIFQLVRLLQLRRPEFFTDFEEYKRCYAALHVHLESANVYANF